MLINLFKLYLSKIILRNKLSIIYLFKWKIYTFLFLSLNVIFKSLIQIDTIIYKISIILRQDILAERLRRETRNLIGQPA
jgi:hypothetical protein